MATYKWITQRKPTLVPETEMEPALRSGTGGTPLLLQLQRTHGNRYVQRLVARSKPDRALIQPKLMVGPANDKYEQEADHVAQQLIWRSGSAEVIPGRTASSLQRVGGKGGFEAGSEVESRIA